MARFNRSIRREYPLVEETYDISVQLKVGVSGSAPQAVPEQKFTNFKLTDRDGTGLILLGAAQLASARLAPYCGWDLFFATFKTTYNALKKITGYRNLSRISTRYIN